MELKRTALSLWLESMPEEARTVFNGVHWQTFLKQRRNESFQMIGQYDGAMSEECKQAFSSELILVAAFLDGEPASRKSISR